jgi:hypothetical protein
MVVGAIRIQVDEMNPLPVTRGAFPAQRVALPGVVPKPAFSRYADERDRPADDSRPAT